ncbi:hypothetical protein OESDEN_08059 [Oesophagostomum dentatum]|uniref:Peptidase S9 prolyl oligopeptidase catalytic domain-containing protein n=1 Tax=Oesophagostomum dentatum TaxID=61180 RepID=A0A0B1T9N2_OESDE|nr:hypothetical protein OESDEN_08059 [Oesophagostomum dentatum]
MELLLKNERFAGLIADNDLNIRFGVELQQDASEVYYRRKAQVSIRLPMTTDLSEWERYLVISPEDGATSTFLSFDRSNQYMYWKWGENSNLDSLVKVHIDYPQNKEVIYSPIHAEIDSILYHPTDHTVLAVSENYHKPELHVLNDTVREDLKYLINFRPNDPLSILAASLDMSVLLVTYTSPDKPYEIYVYNTNSKSIKHLLNLRPELKQYSLYKQVGFAFRARDGMMLQAYISLPLNVPLRTAVDVPEADKGYAELGMLPLIPQKMVVDVHGGPGSRNIYSFAPRNAWLTSRGYAVLQVNYRGSTGFGKQLTNAGNGEWGRKMHFDILDAVEFAVEKGIANKFQIAIMGVQGG